MLRLRPRAALAALSGLLAACGWSPGDVPPLECRVLVAPAAAPDPVRPGDTLDVVLALPGRREPLDVLVRVDPLESGGIVRFRDRPPSTAAGAGATVTTRAIWTVCVSSAPRAVVFRGEATPHGKAWVRLSTDRPVRVLVRTGSGDGAALEPPLVVEPGGSARARWKPAGADG